MTREQELKNKAITILQEHLTWQAESLRTLDERLGDYFDDVAYHPDYHNLYEILGAVKFLRLLRTYEFNPRRVRQAIRLREGEWRQDADGMWHHVKGGLKCPGTQRPQVYRWEPFQVFVLASVFGFQAWIDTNLTTADRTALADTERVEDGRIMDLRRLCTNFTLFSPRKTDKTGLSAYIQVWFFLKEDWNAEIYCCANSSDQAKLLYRRTKMMLQQLDDGHRLRMTETVCDWKAAYKSVRDTSVRPLSAGGRTKDGMFAQLCCRDEYGSAGYVNGKSDMKMLVDVIDSSMGPRREPLDFTTTTAGRVQQGPFIDFLDGLHRLLEKEIDYEEGTEQPTLTGDRMLCLCLEPDMWERDEETLLTSKTVRRKINPMLGKIVQHQFYEDEIEKARIDGDTSEVISKLLNVYQSSKMLDWIRPEEIRELQIPMRIDDCTKQRGWIVFAGCDFSKGDDLNVIGYLAVNLRTREFFADTDAWVSEKAASESNIADLYRLWDEKKWMTIVKGATFDPAAVVSRVAELTEKGVDIWRIGYDPYNAAIVINALAAYISEMGLEPKKHIMVVKQGYATYNSVVNEFDYMVHRSDPAGKPWPMIHFSESPLLPWQFGNVALGVSTDGYENKKPIKRNDSQSCKVDSIQAILSALVCYDIVDGGRVDNNDQNPKGHEQTN